MHLCRISSAALHQSIIVLLNISRFLIVFESLDPNYFIYSKVRSINVANSNIWATRMMKCLKFLVDKCLITKVNADFCSLELTNWLFGWSLQLKVRLSCIHKAKKFDLLALTRVTKSDLPTSSSWIALPSKIFYYKKEELEWVPKHLLC